MTALIRCCLHLSMEQIEAMNDDQFYEAWGQVKFFMSLAYMVKFE